MLQAQISWTLSESAQRAMMVATGQPVALKQSEVIEIAPEELEYVNVGADGSMSKTYRLPVCDFRTGREVIDAIKAEAAATQLADPRAAEWIDNLDASADNGRDVASRAMKEVGQQPWNPECAPLTKAAAERLQDRIAQATAAKKAAEQAKEAAKQAAEQAKEKAKAEYLAQWALAQGGDLADMQRDGLLCRAAALESMAAQVFAELGERYDPVICDNRSCSCGRTGIDCLPRHVYPKWKALKAKLPEGSTWELEGIQECLRDDDGVVDDGEPDATAARWAVLLHVPAGPFTLDRLVRLS